MVNTRLRQFSGLAAYAGESVPLRGDDFKRYVNSLRGKVGTLLLYNIMLSFLVL